MASLLGLGDNCVDIYVDQDIQFPGGNAVNVAVFCARLGIDASYLGCIGTDPLGDIIRQSLQAENIGIERLRIEETVETPWTRIRHTDGDRYFDGSVLPKPEDYKLESEDFHYLAGFDLVHTSVYSKLDNELDRIRASAQQLAYDFSNKYNDDILSRVAPSLDIAIISASDENDDEAKALCESVAAHGTNTVIATRGSKGAVCLHDGVLRSQSIVETEVVDTLGAGDAFISGFLASRLTGGTIQAALQVGAEHGADACSKHGAFGRGVEIMEGQPGLAKP